MQKLIVMRGLPSSGKSTRAKILAGENGLVFSTDDFFYQVEESFAPNKYSFNPNRLGEAHRWNQRRAFEAMESGVEVVVIDNTNTTKKEPKPYIEKAQELGISFFIEEPDSPHWVEMRPVFEHKKAEDVKKWSAFLANLSKKTHNVPQQAIERMFNRWQEFSVEDF